MKICQLCTVDFTLKTLLLPLVDGMAKSGWEVTCICADGKWVEQMRRDGYRIQTVQMSRRITALFSHIRSLVALYCIFRRYRFDVLHVHSPIAGILGRLAGRLAGIPVIIYTAHGFHFHEDMGSGQYRFYVLLERLAGKLTDFIFTQNQEDRQAAIKHKIMAESKVLAIGNGVDPKKFLPSNVATKASIRQELHIPNGVPVIGVVCRMVREKGVVELLEAAVSIVDRFPDTHFLFVGERIPSERDSPFDEEWQNAMAKLGSRLVATGYRPDVDRMLAAMDIFCLPSYREGMPRSIIEAMMMGLAVVATDIRGAREEVVPGVTGLLVAARDAGALRQSLERLLANPELAHRMGGAGRQRALDLYDENHVIARQIEVIGGLLDRSV